MTGDVCVRAFQSGGDLVLSDQADADEAQVTGRWVRSDRPAEVRQ